MRDLNKATRALTAAWRHALSLEKEAFLKIKREKGVKKRDKRDEREKKGEIKMTRKMNRMRMRMRLKIRK